MVHFCRIVIKKILLCECKKWGYSSQKEPFCNFCLSDRDMTIFSYSFFELNKSSEIPKIFHNFILFYRIISYWKDLNKKVVDEYFEVLDLNKHYVCKHFWKFLSTDSPNLHWLSLRTIFSFFLGEIFNREGDLTLSAVDLKNFSHQTCNGCKNFIFIGFKKIYPPTIIRRIYGGLCLVERESEN